MWENEWTKQHHFEVKCFVFFIGKKCKFLVGTITLRDSAAGKEVPIQIKLGDQITTVIEGSEVPVTEDIPIYRYILQYAMHEQLLTILMPVLFFI